MFTGIVETTAKVRSIASQDLWLDVSFAGELEIGQSVACSGVCLTVVEKDDEGFLVELMEETRQKTYFGELKTGDLVNIERAMPANGRFDGHIVQGHVDGVGKIKAQNSKFKNNGILNMVELELGISVELNKYIVQKGSICLDGISLTVISVDKGLVKVGIIPHTWKVTNLHTKRVGDKVNVEVDVLAKYVEKMQNVKCKM